MSTWNPGNPMSKYSRLVSTTNNQQQCSRVLTNIHKSNHGAAIAGTIQIKHNWTSWVHKPPKYGNRFENELSRMIPTESELDRWIRIERTKDHQHTASWKQLSWVETCLARHCSYHLDQIETKHHCYWCLTPLNFESAIIPNRRRELFLTFELKPPHDSNEISTRARGLNVRAGVEA